MKGWVKSEGWAEGEKKDMDEVGQGLTCIFDFGPRATSVGLVSKGTGRGR